MAKIRALGGTVHQHGASWQQADEYLRAQFLAHDASGIYVPPFDHPDIWAGNATCMDELAAQLALLPRDESEDWDGKPDAVVCSVGGGGLLNGVVSGLDAQGWGSCVKVVAVETRGADSLACAVQAGRLVTLPAITSMATSLGCARVAAQSFANAQRDNVRTLVLDDAQAARAAWRFADDERMLVEAACAVSLAPCYEPDVLSRVLPGLTARSRIVIIVCGGSNVSLEILEGYRRKFGSGAMTRDDVPSSVTAPS